MAGEDSAETVVGWSLEGRLAFCLFPVTHHSPGSFGYCMNECLGDVKGLAQVHHHTWGGGTSKRGPAKDRLSSTKAKVGRKCSHVLTEVVSVP